MEQTWTISEFVQMKRKQNTLKALKQIGADEYIAKRMMSDKRLKVMVTFSLAGLMSIQEAYAANPTKNALGKIDVAGSVLLSVIRTIGYWICIIMCIIEILKCLAQGDTKEIGKIVMKYLLAFATFYLLPWLYDLIAGIFA